MENRTARPLASLPKQEDSIQILFSPKHGVVANTLGLKLEGSERLRVLPNKVAYVKEAVQAVSLADASPKVLFFTPCNLPLLQVLCWVLKITFKNG